MQFHSSSIEIYKTTYELLTIIILVEVTYLRTVQDFLGKRLVVKAPGAIFTTPNCFITCEMDPIR